MSASEMIITSMENGRRHRKPLATEPHRRAVPALHRNRLGKRSRQRAPLGGVQLEQSAPGGLEVSFSQSDHARQQRPDCPVHLSLGIQPYLHAPRNGGMGIELDALAPSATPAGTLANVFWRRGSISDADPQSQSLKSLAELVAAAPVELADPKGPHWYGGDRCSLQQLDKKQFPA